MNIKQVIDFAVNQGAKKLSLSNRQFNKVKRHLKVRNGKPTYRGCIISRWENRTEKSVPEDRKIRPLTFTHETEESREEIGRCENEILDRAERFGWG